MVYKLLVDSMKYAKQHSIRHRQQIILRTDVKLQWQYLAAEIEKHTTYQLQPMCLA